MSKASPEQLEKIRQQFDFQPYPQVPIDYSPKNDPSFLFIHNAITPYYLRDQTVIDPSKTVILDAGCGSGSKCLALAQANPGAKIVGVDLSERSVEFARKRMEYHGIENTEFHAIGIEELPKLGLEFDYINCDEVLYFFSDIADGLRAMGSVLKPQGIIRSNLHNALQRSIYFRAQNVFKLMGLMDNNPEELEIELAIDILRALRPNVQLKAALPPELEEMNRNQWVLANLLLQEDKGYAVHDLFDGLRRAGLEFINMVNWQQWDLMSLFQKPDDLPPFLAMSLPGCSAEEKLRLYELFNARHRLLDFWCGHSNQAQPKPSLEAWDKADWEAATVYLHPQLNTSEVRESLADCLEQQAPFMITRFLPNSVPEGENMIIDGTIVAVLFPLWESPQPFTTLLDRYLKLKPVDAVTLEPVSIESATEQLTRVIKQLESYLYLMLKSEH